MRWFIFSLFMAGLVSVFLLIVYVFSFFLFVFGEGSHPGLIAFVPRWIFLFSFLVLLEKTSQVQDVLREISSFSF